MTWLGCYATNVEDTNLLSFGDTVSITVAYVPPVIRKLISRGTQQEINY
jgi:hypothetical protein